MEPSASEVLLAACGCCRRRPNGTEEVRARGQQPTVRMNGGMLHHNGVIDPDYHNQHQLSIGRAEAACMPNDASA